VFSQQRKRKASAPTVEPTLTVRDGFLSPGSGRKFMMELRDQVLSFAAMLASE
jgi:hypothetical protein